jgi:hypothetical protein
MIEGFHLVLVCQFRLFDPLILGNQLLNGLFALGLYVMVLLFVLLHFVTGVPQEFCKSRRQGSGSQLAGIDHQGQRFVFNLFLQIQSSPL